MVHSEPIFLSMHVLALSRESSPSACLPTCLQLLIPFYPRDEQTLSSPQSVASPLALLLFSSSIPPSLLSPPFPFFPPLSHRSLFPQRPQDSLCFWSFSDSELDNVSASLHSPRPRGGKQGLLLPLLFASSSDVLKKTIDRQGAGEERDSGRYALKSVGPKAWNGWLSSLHLVMVWPIVEQGLLSLTDREMLQCHIAILSIQHLSHSYITYQQKHNYSFPPQSFIVFQDKYKALY